MGTKILVALALGAFLPSTALAGAVMLKNKDGKSTTILVKRSNSTTETAIAGRATMELPGAPLTITVKKTGSKIEAVDGETVVIQKGKLTKLTPPPEEGADVEPATRPEEAPTSAPESSPVPEATATPETAPAPAY